MVTGQARPVAASQDRATRTGTVSPPGAFAVAMETADRDASAPEASETTGAGTVKSVWPAELTKASPPLRDLAVSPALIRTRNAKLAGAAGPLSTMDSL